MTGSNTTAALLTGLWPLPVKSVWDVYFWWCAKQAQSPSFPHKAAHTPFRQNGFIVINPICASIVASLPQKKVLSTSLHPITLQIDYKVLLMKLWMVLRRCILLISWSSVTHPKHEHVFLVFLLKHTDKLCPCLTWLLDLYFMICSDFCVIEVIP